MEQTQTPIESKTTVSLADALEFTPDELNANRAGDLSPMQHYRLRARRRRAALIGVGMVLIAAFAATTFLFLGSRDGGSPILTLVGIGVTFVSAALSGSLLRFWLRLHADIQGQRVEATRGTLERVLKPINRRVINYMIRIDEAEVFVSKQAWEAFEHDAEYVIYRAPNTGTLFTAERVD